MARINTPGLPLNTIIFDKKYCLLIIYLKEDDRYDLMVSFYLPVKA